MKLSKISTRDLRLLLGLAVVLILAIPYFIVIRPMTDKTDAINTEIETLDSRYRSLSAMEVNRAVYLEQTEQYQIQKAEVIDHFPAAINQEASILFFYETENNVPVTLSSLNFTGNTENVITQQTETEAGLTAISTTTQISYESTYENFKRLAAYLEGFEDRVVVTDISATYNAETDRVSGNFTLQQYAIAGADREVPITTIPNVELGTDNIFEAYSGNSAGNASLYGVDYDYFLMLSNPNADVAGKLLCKSYDTDQTSALESFRNEKEDVTIIVDGEDGNYTIAYRIGEESFGPVSYLTAEDGMIFAVLSSQRVGSSDSVAADLYFTNYSDMPLTVYVSSDDLENPRVVIKGLTGDIEVMQ